jgi:hypothetical protein
MVTHVWIYHRKLYVEQGKDVRALRIQDLFFEQLWEDYMHRLAAEKVGSFMLSKYLKDVQQLSFQVCMLYDEALAKADENDPDDTEVVNALGGIIWNNIYERRDDIPEEHILEFARYDLLLCVFVSYVIFKICILQQFPLLMIRFIGISCESTRECSIYPTRSS